MKWLSQFSLVMRSNITSLCEQVENPERMLHQLIIDMEEELATAKRSVAEAIADEIMMRKTVDREASEVELWGQRAEAAMKRGDEATARSALQQRLTASKRVEQYTKEHAIQASEVLKLQDSIRMLQDKIRQAKQKKTLLTARLARASSTNKINSVIDRVDSQSAFSQFTRLEQRVEREEAVTEAWERLDGESDESNELRRQFESEEREELLNSELAALKAKIGT
jgi:phage shock protein A